MSTCGLAGGYRSRLNGCVETEEERNGRRIDRKCGGEKDLVGKWRRFNVLVVCSTG